MLVYNLAGPLRRPFEQETRMPGGPLHGKDFAKGFLRQWDGNLPALRKLAVSRFGIIHNPVDFGLARPGQRFVAGDGKVFELDKGGVVALHSQAQHFFIKESVWPLRYRSHIPI